MPGSAKGAEGLLVEIWASSVWRLYPLLFFYCTCAPTLCAQTWAARGLSGQQCRCRVMCVYPCPSAEPAAPAGGVTVLPLKPLLMTNFFAAREGTVVHCENFTSATAPQAGHGICMSRPAQPLLVVPRGLATRTLSANAAKHSVARPVGRLSGSSPAAHVQACLEAHSKVITWSSWSDFIANAGAPSVCPHSS